MLAIGLFSFAQQANEAPQEVSSPRALTIADADDWKSVRQFVLSPNGHWYGHIVMPNEGNGELCIARTASVGDASVSGSEPTDTAESDTAESGEQGQESGPKAKPSDHYEIVVGPGSSQIKFSHDSKFAAWMQAPMYKAGGAAKQPDAAPKNMAVLLNLETGEKTEFKSAQSFNFSGENPKSLAIHKMKPKGRPSGEQGWNGTDLLIHDLQTGGQINIGNVKSYSFNKSGNMLAMVIDAEGKSGNGVQLFHVDDSRIEILDSGEFTYGSMSWTREGDAIALLKSKSDEKFKTDLRHLLAFSDVGTSKQKMVTLDPATDSSIPDNMTISSNRTPQWNDERSAIFFGIHELEKKAGKSKDDQPEQKPESKTANDKDAGLVIWHWKDPRLQSMQQKQESRDKNQFDLCIHHVDSKSTFRLGDEEIPQVSVSRPYQFAIGRNNEKYELAGNLDGRRLQDIYTIDLTNGKSQAGARSGALCFRCWPRWSVAAVLQK